jgi:hypothetical protein
MPRRVASTFLLLYISLSGFSQDKADTTETAFLKRVFLPSIDIGYQIPTSDLIEGSLRIATSIEYRFRNNNDFFIRLNYDTYNLGYRFEDANNTSNALEGTANVSDVFLAPGYRFGDSTWRLMFSVMPGIKFYEYPELILDENAFQVVLRSESIFTTSFLTTLEYYFDEKSAFTFSLYQNQVWEDTDFWQDGRAAYGFSIGFITSLL